MRSRTREWWIWLPFQIGLLIVLTLLFILNYRDFDPVDIGVITTLLLVAFLIEEYRISRLKDQLNSLKKQRITES